MTNTSGQQINLLDDFAALVVDYQAAERIETQFYLSPTFVASQLEKYYLLRWQGDYLISKVDTCLGIRPDTLTHQDTVYHLRYIALTPYDLVANQDAQYKLSFRKHKNSQTGVVLIKKV